MKGHKRRKPGSRRKGGAKKAIEAVGNPIRVQTTKGLKSKKPKVVDSHGWHKSLKLRRPS